MSERIDTLITCLAEKEMLLGRLLSVTDSERGLIAGMDAAGLESGREEKLHLIALVDHSTAACRKALEAAAVDLELPSAENLSAVIKAVAPDRGKVLESLQARLIELVAALDRGNRFNASLLQGSLRMINRSLEFYSRGFGAASTYSDSGMIVSGVPDGRLVRGEI